MEGTPVKTLKQLCNLAMSKKCVLVRLGGVYRRIPAAFIANWQGFTLNRLLNSGQIIKYKKEV